MNWVGPTARSQAASWSSAPPSVSGIAAFPPVPVSCGPRIGCTVVPSASTAPPDACPDSTLPIPATSGHVSPQDGAVRSTVVAAER